jgi:hypothetical protein
VGLPREYHFFGGELVGMAEATAMMAVPAARTLFIIVMNGESKCEER